MTNFTKARLGVLCVRLLWRQAAHHHLRDTMVGCLMSERLTVVTEDELPDQSEYVYDLYYLDDTASREDMSSFVRYDDHVMIVLTQQGAI